MLDAPQGPAGDCLVALGGNLGDVAGNFRQALDRMVQAGLQLQAVSRLYRTQALLWPGSAPQADYVNAACLLHTHLTPLQLLDLLQAIEAQVAARHAERWAPRALDLDLVACKNFYLVTPRLTLPHPRAQQRGFVLLPCADVAPLWRLRGQGATLQALLRRLPIGQRTPKNAVLSWRAAP